MQSCKGICLRIKGIKKRVRSTDPFFLDYVKCNNCEICFPKKFSVIRCVCCSQQLTKYPCDKSANRIFNKKLEMLGLIKRI